ncbi:DUF389 domain-containing protein [Denitrificimonas sp. JX-1]|uniref:DUF389 domain-containing protein n=1 Tax=Denitrificimonas halotolerans TaxID=3098930 RepID=A0ABU5GS09_9GAMM|nr:DUF389 domain-containing protein [Denitrificimonas sp. JX-1]MDY7219150.1 DUF389 domain-containing protein [Denitrificimonas sp. JX-1]
MLCSKALFIYDDAENPKVQTVIAFAKNNCINLEQLSIQAFLEQPGRPLDFAEHVIALCTDADLAPLIDQAKSLNFSLGIIPTDSHQTRLREWFLFHGKTDEHIQLAFSTSTKPIDVLRCNDEVALGSIMLGQTPFLDQRSRTYRKRTESTLHRIFYFFVVLWGGLRNLFNIHPFAITLSVGEEYSVKTAITGMVSIENNVHNAAARLINTSISIQDGKVSTLLIAPKSISQYLSFLFKASFNSDKKVTRLPNSMSYVRSNYLRVESNTPLTYYVDSQKREAQSIELELYPEAVHINLPEAYYETQGGQRGGKDTLKLENLPLNEQRLDMIQQRLPLFTNALEDDFKELFVQLRRNAQSSSSFVALMMLSSLIASLGLFLSSSAVIIGAMVLAPLMSPIISLAMGLLRNDHSLMKNAITTIAKGIALALTMAALIALIIPITRVTPEIAGRLHPNLLDLGVAIFSGIAGAYAYARESIMKSMPGVAIAVALVPPLCVAGIGIGWWDWQIISGSALLFTTNLVGIALSASLTFLVLGYAPLVKARRGLALSSALMLAIAIPLTWSFQSIYSVWKVEQKVNAMFMEVHGKTLHIEALQVQVGLKETYLKLEVSSNSEVTYSDLKALKVHLEEQLKTVVRLDVTPRISL